MYEASRVSIQSSFRGHIRPVPHTHALTRAHANANGPSPTSSRPDRSRHPEREISEKRIEKWEVESKGLMGTCDRAYNKMSAWWQVSSNWDNHSKVSVSEGEECSGHVMSSLGLWIKERDGETPAVRGQAQVLIPSLWTSNSAESESLRRNGEKERECSLTQCGVMRGLLQRTIRAERDKRDKKGEDRGSDQSFSLRWALSYSFRNYKWKKKGTIYPLYYRQESVSFPDMTMYLQREKNLQMKCTKYSWCKKRKKKEKREKTK